MSDRPLIEGEDYVIENGLYVFTRSYLLRRGFCCCSGCRNCPYPRARIVSMVPSWTEALLAAGANVVGRTRFCVHPEDEVGKISVVGGTKDINWERVKELNADILLLDREENPLSMYEESPVATIATHVESVSDVANELDKIAGHLGGPSVRALKDLASRWREVLKRPQYILNSWDDLPGVREWLKKPDHPPSQSKVIYVIWKNPWMAVGHDTFIASMLERAGLGLSTLLPQAAEEGQKYPAFEPESLPPDTVFLFSTEPYPFHKKKKDLYTLGQGAAIVEGESFSWFGLRSLRFLEGLKYASR